jgi:hypothetical protein
MRVLLVDIDSMMPNLALMKLSAWHQMKGDTVGFNTREPDVVYASVIFKKNQHLTDGLKFMYPEAKIILGGSGHSLNLWLPDEIEALCPNYSLYPEMDYSLGFTSRGCIRHCSFCWVPDKEGMLYHKEEMRPQHWVKHSKAKLLDNNWYADRAWFFEMSQWFIDHDVSVDLTQGMDIRLLTPEIAEQLKKLKWWAPIHFAFDDRKYEEKVLSGIQTLRDAGMEKTLRHSVFFYVYCNDDSQYEDAVDRCRILKREGTSAFVMFNCENEPTKRIKRLQRWANKPWLFWSIDIDQYNRKLVKS